MMTSELPGVYTSTSLAVYEVPTDRVTYNYRYFLPYPPTWGSLRHCRQRLRELLSFCADAKIDAVQFFVNQMPHTIGTPPRSAEEQLEWAAWMRDEVAPAIRAAQMSYQLNFQLILGHGGFGIDMSDEYDWEFLVDQEGHAGEGCACPLGPKFRDKMGAMLRLWAGTFPGVIWIDDDFRMHNHRMCKPDSLDYYCFCDIHLKRFAERYGRHFSRQELVAELERPGVPSEWRHRWQAFISDGMVDAARWIRDEISSVSPNTRTALMTSMPDTHSVEGRDWRETLVALSGEHKPMVRPCCGVYSSNLVPIKNNAVTYQLFESTMQMLRGAVGDNNVDFAPELENARFTTWANPVSHCHYVLVLAQLLGCPHITLSINDLDGSPLSEEPANIPMLRGIRPRLEALTKLDLASWDQLGLAFICDPEIGSKVAYAAGDKLGSQPIARSLENLLMQVGIPGCYVSPAEATECSHVIALDGLTAWSLSDTQLKSVLGRSLLMDASAAAVLEQRGFGDYLGITVGRKMGFGIHSEIFHDGILPGVHAARVPHLGLNWHELHLNGASVASEFIDTKYRFYPGTTIFKNEIGGKVAVFANIGNCEPYAEWANHARMRHLHGLLYYLSDDTFPALPKLSSHGLTVLRRRGNELLLALANLSTDNLVNPGFKLGIADHVHQVHVLRGENWVAMPDVATTDGGGLVSLSIHETISPNAWAIARVTLRP